MAAPPCSRPTRTLSQGLREPHVLRIPTHSSAGLKGKANPSCSSYAMYFCRPGSEALSLFLCLLAWPLDTVNGLWQRGGGQSVHTQEPSCCQV